MRSLSRTCRAPSAHRCETAAVWRTMSGLRLDMKPVGETKQKIVFFGQLRVEHIGVDDDDLADDHPLRFQSLQYQRWSRRRLSERRGCPVRFVLPGGSEGRWQQWHVGISWPWKQAGRRSTGAMCRRDLQPRVQRKRIPLLLKPSPDPAAIHLSPGPRYRLCFALPHSASA